LSINIQVLEIKFLYFWVNTKKVLVFPYLLQRLRTNKGKLSFFVLIYTKTPLAPLFFGIYLFQLSLQKLRRYVK